MQRVTNCILLHNDKVLLLKKPRRGWYAAPGGKMEKGESIKESVVREYREETELQLIEPELAGVFTFSIFHGEKLMQEWMMFTFFCEQYTGALAHYCREGDLEWVTQQMVSDLPMAEGDRKIFEHVLDSDKMLYGSFQYKEDFDLIDCRFDPSHV
ncbi:NUDIX hydrolase [Lentibacillus amyloliquefaciens]|uniref:NUDIX hydrolase n=1 Tax=Lentibacillus amyloliquefaciens TaxID=1472767 RepID=A0A0U4EAU0_9BACI|nr:8-oxo-dGTP diphosphatase [Lentibacillus amyloliquefaciens]ALX50380.1 NUDIX hydrolase [Lentibacillus amyloliquefaciens]